METKHPTNTEDQPSIPPFEHHLVKAIYDILCDDVEPPEGEHWEGFAARRIVHLIETVPTYDTREDDLIARIDHTLRNDPGPMLIDSWVLRALRDRIVEQDLQISALDTECEHSTAKITELRAQLAERDSQPSMATMAGPDGSIWELHTDCGKYWVKVRDEGGHWLTAEEKRAYAPPPATPNAPVASAEEVQALSSRLKVWPSMELEEVMFHDAIEFMRYVGTVIDRLAARLEGVEHNAQFEYMVGFESGKSQERDSFLEEIDELKNQLAEAQEDARKYRRSRSYPNQG